MFFEQTVHRFESGGRVLTGARLQLFSLSPGLRNERWQLFRLNNTLTVLNNFDKKGSFLNCLTILRCNYCDMKALFLFFSPFNQTKTSVYRRTTITAMLQLRRVRIRRVDIFVNVSQDTRKLRISAEVKPVLYDYLGVVFIKFSLKELLNFKSINFILTMLLLIKIRPFRNKIRQSFHAIQK